MKQKQVSIVASSVAPIQPGCSQAVLVLDDGRKVFLKEEEERVISEDKGITVYRGKRSFSIYFFRGKKCRRDPFQ